MNNAEGARPFIPQENPVEADPIAVMQGAQAGIDTPNAGNGSSPSVPMTPEEIKNHIKQAEEAINRDASAISVATEAITASAPSTGANPTEQAKSVNRIVEAENAYTTAKNRITNSSLWLGSGGLSTALIGGGFFSGFSSVETGTVALMLGTAGTMAITGSLYALRLGWAKLQQKRAERSIPKTV